MGGLDLYGGDEPMGREAGTEDDSTPDEPLKKQINGMVKRKAAFRSFVKEDPAVGREFMEDINRELKRVDEEIATAERDGAEARVAELQERRDDILRHKNKSFNKYGELRPSVDSNARRSRKAAKKAMDDALAAVKKTMPKLAYYLKINLATRKSGPWCYNPPEDIDWDFSDWES